MNKKRIMISLVVTILLFFSFLAAAIIISGDSISDFFFGPAKLEQKSIIKQRSKEPKTGNTSKFNNDTKPKNYEETIKEFKNKDNLSSDELYKLIKSNSTFILRANGNENDDKLIDDVNNKNNFTIYSASNKEILKCDKEHNLQILLTDGSVAYIKKGLVTSQFDIKFQKDKNKLSSSYEDWVKNIIKQNNTK